VIRSLFAGVAGCCLLLSACADSAERSTNRRAPAPAPDVTLTADERSAWTPGPADRSAVPVLRYTTIDRERFARQMALLDHAGYETIELDEFLRFVKGDEARLPPRPLLLTFDGVRLDTWTGTDAILRELRFNAVLFVNVGHVEAGDRDYLTWRELGRLQASGRWDIQLQSGTGGRQIQYGPAADDVGPFYAYRGTEEILGGWRERVFSDITYGEQQLAHHIEGYRPLAFAPPYGNYGQAGTNDPRIPRELLDRLLLSFQVVFTQDRSGLATPGARNPLGRFDITRNLTEAHLHALLHRR
jgi:peptidoglycan/xylan/chitin deacetylase (PgdA/CDA1 family)